MSAHLRAGAVSRTETTSAAAGGCPRSEESAVLRAFEDASRTRGGCFRHRISLPYRRSLFFTPDASENASRTTGACFAHRTHIPYRRSLFLVPSPLTHRGRLPPQRSLAYILVDLLRALGSAAINLVNFRLKSSLASQNTNKFKRTLPSVT